ncbi:MAG TPA: MarC family protein [Candidatus Nitrosotalea sp.]|nr:MarC family protein [Candidatus Nitrosotalea sp.]
MNGYLDEFLFAFVTLIAVINPISAAAVFASLTEGRSPQDQAAIARRATIVAGVTLIAFAFAGEALLGALGVKIGAFKIAGGLLLLKVAFEMVFAQTTHRDVANRAKANAPPAGDPSVFPLAIPMITGPGALTAGVALVNPTNTRNYINGAIFVVVAVVVIGINYLFMLGAEKLTRRVGATGIDAVSRIVGIIVAAIAVQLVVDGVSSLTHFTMG